MQKLDLLITARRWEQAEKILRVVGIIDSERADHREVNGQFLVTTELKQSLNTEQYTQISEHEDISILSDSDSQQRAKDISDHLYSVEILLRKLLLHIPDLVDTFYPIITAQLQYYSGPKRISQKNSFDPIASQLTLGQMVAVLEFNSKWQKDVLSSDDLFKLLHNVDTLANLRDKLAPVPVWEIVSQNVLWQPVSWKEISGDLKQLIPYRNKSAHYRVVTESEKDQAVLICRHLLETIIPKKLKHADQIALQEATNGVKEGIAKSSGNGGYPVKWAAAEMDSIVDNWGMYNRESVSYAAFKASQIGRPIPGGWGNANNWPNRARAAGYTVDQNPTPGSIAVSLQGPYGHVMFVEAVNGTFVSVSQYNLNGDGEYSVMKRPAAGLQFIHL